MSKSSMNLQDSFLNQVRRENTEVKILLINGTTLRGIVKGFDNFTVIVANRNGQHLVYKHAIAQLVNHRPTSNPGAGRRDGEEGSVGGSDTQLVGGETGEEAGVESGEMGGLLETGETTPETSGGGAERGSGHSGQGGHGAQGKGSKRDGNRENRNRGADRGDRNGDRGTDRGNSDAQQQKARKDGFNTLDLSRVKLGEGAENAPQEKVESTS